MPFIGNQPADKFLTLEKQVFTTSATDTYTLDREVSSVNDIELFLNNVRQEPTEAYTISGTTLTLASAITASDSMYCIYQGRAVGTQSPATGSVTNDMLAGSIATSKLADITANGITEVDLWELTATFNSNAQPISANLARASVLNPYTGTGMSVSSGIWTFPSTGIWQVDYHVSIDEQGGGADQIELEILYSSNGGSTFSTYLIRANESVTTTNTRAVFHTSTAIKITDTANQVIRFDVGNLTNPNRILGTAGSQYTTFKFIKLREI